MKKSLAVAACSALAVTALGAGTAAAAPSAAAPSTTPGAAAAGTTAPAAAAARGAAALLAARPAALHVSAADTFTARKVVAGERGLQYVPYDRTYHGVPVLGGDVVVVTDASGAVLSTSTGQQQQTLDLATSPALTSARAAGAAAALLPGGRASGTTLVVDALTTTPRLAWQSLVTGTNGTRPVRLRVVVDATTGAVLSSQDEVVDGTGSGAINGGVTLSTTHSGSTYSMTDSTRPGLSCRDFTSKTTFTGPDDVWGNGVGTNRETGCVDALYDVQQEWTMLGSWLGRSGINGNGGGFPEYVGLNDENAYWDGTSVNIGYNSAGAWIGSQDVVGHEFGHAIDDNTPGGLSANGVSEATGDIFGTSLEFFSNNPNDPPDYSIGEEVNLTGSGPIRYMNNPTLVGDPACYTSSIPSGETHAAAGPLDHWFFLVSGGASTAGGSQVSKCNSATVSGGLGVKDSLRVFYSAMLSKTSSMTYLKYRTATLNAVKNVFPNDCAKFNTVKAAWDAITVPAQAADPTCSSSTQVIVNNPGARTGTAGTAITPFTVTASGGTGAYTWSATGLPAGVAIAPTTGVVSGTPTVSGSFTATVTAKANVSGSTSFAFTVSPAGTCSTQRVTNPGFESGTTGWTGTAGAIGQWASSGEAAHSGTYSAWLDGYGTTHTESVSQTVTRSTGCAGTLSFWLHIDSAETTTTVSYDKLTVSLGGTTLATYSNLNKATGYQLKTLTLPAGAATAALTFSGSEDSSLQTSFVLDDVTITG